MNPAGEEQNILLAKNWLLRYYDHNDSSFQFITHDNVGRNVGWASNPIHITEGFLNSGRNNVQVNDPIYRSAYSYHYLPLTEKNYITWPLHIFSDPQKKKNSNMSL